MGQCMDVDGVAVPSDADNSRSSQEGGGGSKVDLYHFPASPPCWAVIMAGRAVGVDFRLRTVNVMAMENLKPEFLKINPEHTVPTIDDHGFILWESRAIMQYLVDQYAKTDTLNPRNPKKAALVNQRLFFDASTLYPRLRDYFLPVVKHGFRPDPDRVEKFREGMDYLEVFLEGQSWVAGPKLTVADFAIAATVATAEAVLYDTSKHPNVQLWYQRAQKVMEPYDYKQIVESGANMIGSMFKRKVKIWSK